MLGKEGQGGAGSNSRDRLRAASSDKSLQPTRSPLSSRSCVVTPQMVSAGVFALQQVCPFDVAFPVGGEDAAVEAVLNAALKVWATSS